jgi:hypothetical protein
MRFWITNNSFMAFSISSLNLFGFLYGVVIIGLDPSSKSMTCLNPWPGGIPVGSGSNTFSCLPSNSCMSTW